MCRYRIYDFKTDGEREVTKEQFERVIEIHTKWGEIETETIGSEIWYYRKDIHRTYIGSKQYEEDH